MASKLAKSKNTAVVLTHKANYHKQEQAKLLTNFIRAVFDEEEVYKKQRSSDIYAICTGTGFLHTYTENDKIKIECVPSTEIYVDPIDAAYGNPQSIYRIKVTTKQFLIDKHPEKAEEIEASSSPSNYLLDLYGIPQDSKDEYCTVFYGWHKSNNKKIKGKYVSCTSNVLLEEKIFTEDKFPFASFRFQDVPQSIFGKSFVADLVGKQVQINRNVRTIANQQNLLGVSFVAMKVGSNISNSHSFDNRLGKVILYTDDVPKIIAPQANSPELYSYTDKLKASIYEESGISQLSAQSMKPAGLNSGKALRTYADMESERFTTTFCNREDQIKTLAELILIQAKTIIKSGVDYVIDCNISGKLSKLRLSDLEDILEDEYKVSLSPASSLSNTLAGKLEDLADLQAQGIRIREEEILRLLQVPDLDALTSEMNAPYELIKKQLYTDIMTNKIATTVPDPTQNLQLALTLAQTARAQCQIDNDDGEMDDVLSIIDSYIMRCTDLIDMAQQKPQLPQPSPENINVDVNQDTLNQPASPNMEMQPESPIPG